jgi:hypothetical protein
MAAKMVYPYIYFFTNNFPPVQVPHLQSVNKLTVNKYVKRLENEIIIATQFEPQELYKQEWYVS